MTIPEYIADLQKCSMKPMKPGQPSFVDAMIQDTDIWSNNACCGYCIAAAEHAGLDPEQIQKVITALSWAFDTFTVDEAQTKYETGNY